jgi:predicted nucleic acid-binding Zn ribbon protein
MTETGVRGRLQEIKTEIVSARRAGNDDLAALLSAEKQMVKKRIRNRCVDCGVAIRPDSERCKMHANRHRHYGNSLAALMALETMV